LLYHGRAALVCGRNLLPLPTVHPMLRTLPSALAALLLASFAHAQGSPKDYAPQMNVQCPDVTKAPLLRQFTPQNQTLNAAEEAYVAAREKTVIAAAYKDWVGDGSALGYNISAFANFSRVGIAVSGGGYRAAQYGAGVLSALDARNDSAKAAGTGGVLQVASYISALSGACARVHIQDRARG
jgi:lysophospholipase